VTTDAVPTGDHERYAQLLHEVIPLYEREQYADALVRVRVAAGDLSAHRSDTALLAACLLALDGRADEALAELRADFDDGGWWARQVLVGDDDLATLSSLDGFADLVEAADRRCNDAPRSTLKTVVVGSVTAGRALLVALHGAGSDGARTTPIWQPLATDGIVLLAPTSWQRTTPTHRTWIDATTEWRNVSDVPLPAAVGRVIVAGFSAGGRQAMQWATDPRDLVPAGFLTVCPAIDGAQLNRSALSAAAGRGVRGHVLLGAEDVGSERAIGAVDVLRAEGIDVTVDVVDGLGHDYPSDFVERSRPALASLLAGGGG
jgi:dienelactone hydrolase